MPTNRLRCETLVARTKKQFEIYVKLNKRIPPEMQMTVEKIDSPSKLADTIVAHLNLKLFDKQSILECESAQTRLRRLLEFMEAEIEILQVSEKFVACQKADGEEPEGILSERADASDSKGTW